VGVDVGMDEVGDTVGSDMVGTEIGVDSGIDEVGDTVEFDDVGLDVLATKYESTRWGLPWAQKSSAFQRTTKS
jgi:hypothetical protein